MLFPHVIKKAKSDFKGGNASGGIMVRHAINQRLYGVGANGALDL